MNIDDVNEIKEDLLFIDKEIEGIKLDLAEIKQISPIEESKLLPIGIFLLLLGSLFAFGAYWSLFKDFGGFLFGLNLLLTIPSIYFGSTITRLGLKIKRMKKRTQIVLNKAEIYKEELEKLIAEKQ